MNTEHSHLSQIVIDHLNSKYGFSHYLNDLFVWLWDELVKVAPDAVCKKQKRYIGLYTHKWSRDIFAYIDPQKQGLKIGIFKPVFDKLELKAKMAHDFPAWGSDLVGLMVQNKDPEFVKILTAARTARVDGLSMVRRLQSPKEIETDRLLSLAKQDILSWELEEEHIEGKKRSRHSNYYERNPKLRAQAIAVHGLTCMVQACGFNFQAVYGSRGQDFIEVHHLKPLSTLDPNELQPTIPEKDMVVVCSNCHRMIHRDSNNILSLEEVNALINEHRKKQ